MVNSEIFILTDETRSLLSLSLRRFI